LKGISNEDARRFRNALRFSAADADNHGAGHTLHRASDVIVPDFLTTDPVVEITPYRDLFGNWCSRIVAPAGRMRLAADGVLRDNGQPDPMFGSAIQHAVEDFPRTR
jgi:hypothetical protein